jgi:hypothetical protein
MSTLSDSPASPAATARSADPDEINLLEYFYVLVKAKWRIIGVSALGLVAGLVAAYIKGPEYITEAVITPKESEAQKTPTFSGLGALGGLVASQLNLAGNASLEKIDATLETKKFNADLIDTYGLLPDIYLYKWPKVYREMYDSTRRVWNAEFVKPKPLDMGGFLKGEFLKKEIEDNSMTLQVHSKDSTFSDTLMAKYLEFLNTYLKSSIETEAKENVAYLETRLISVSDPLIREKIMTLIASEIEKAMLVSKEAFKVLDPPYSYMSFKQKRLYPLAFGFGCFFISVLAVIFCHAFSSSEKTEEDRKLIEGIKREIVSMVPGKRRGRG